MGIEKLLADYNIPYVTEGHAKVTAGWVNVHCPFCVGSQNYHLGIHKDGRGAHCWRCGTHSIVDALCKMLNLPKHRVISLLKEYKTGRRNITKAEPKVSIFPIKLPTPNGALSKYYRQYLIRRRFNPDYLERVWGVRETGPISLLDEIDYSHRIIIPIHWDGEMVSFQTRDITGRHKAKYMACPQRREKIHHKDIVYGKQSRLIKSDGIIVVEGVTDVWRLGSRSLATFGISFTMKQVLTLSKLNNKFHIIFDEEPQAQKQAKELAIKLQTLGKAVYVHTIEGDPADLSQEDANHLVKDLLG